MTKIQIVEDDEGKKKRDNKTNRQKDNEKANATTTATANDYVIK